MKNDAIKRHWEEIYRTKDTTTDVSWYQANAATSTELVVSTGKDKNSPIIDIGGGDSRFVDKILELGFKKIFMLDISSLAIEKAKKRLRGKTKSVYWIEADVLEFDTRIRFDIWHDRAMFHFLTKKKDIACYVKIAGKLVKPGGALLLATFSLRGPKRCSGLGIRRHSKSSLKESFGENFSYIKSFEEVHVTPFNTRQIFLFSVFQRK